MSETTRALIDQITAKLKRTVGRLALGEFLALLVLTAASFALALGLAASLEASFWLDAPIRLALLVLILGTLLSGLLLAMGLPALRLMGKLPGLGQEEVAGRIGKRFPEVADRLVDLLHLVSGKAAPGSTALLDRALYMLGSELDPVPFEQVEDFGKARRWGKLALVPAGLVVALFTLAPGPFLGATQRILSPGEAFTRPAPFQLDIRPGTTELVRGSSLDIEVIPAGSGYPGDIELLIRNQDEENVDQLRLDLDSTGAYRHHLVNVRRSFSYRVQAPPVASPWFEVTVVDRPLVRGLQLTLTYPAYTRLPARRLEPNVGDVTALRGTRVDVELETGETIPVDASLRFATGHAEPVVFAGRTGAARFTLTAEDTYQIHLINDQGVENRDRITYALNVQDDGFPFIVLLEPGPVENLTDALDVGLRMRITDDFGFSELRLFYRLAESRFGETSDTFESIELGDFDPNRLDQEVLYTWLLTRFGLDPVPGDRVAYYLEVRDNDSVLGFKAARTPEFSLRIPSLAEQYEKLNEEQDSAQQELESLLRESGEMRESFEELRDEVRRKQDADWEDRRQLDRISQQQQNLESRIEDLRNSMEEMTRQMEDNSLVSPETMEAFRELERVLEEIRSPELEEALRRLQEALQNLDLPQMQQAFQQFEFNEEQYKERLERALELFKRLRAEQMLDEAQKKAEELAKRQEQMAEETKRLMEQPEQRDEPGQEREAPEREAPDGDRDAENRKNGERQDEESAAPKEGSEREKSPEDLAREQEQSAEDMEGLEELLEKIREQLEELRDTPADQLDRVQDRLEQENLPGQMQRNKQDLLNREMQKARSGQQSLQQQLEQLSEQLAGMKNMMGQQQIEVNLAALRRVLDDVLTLSYEQEALRANVQPLSPDNPALRSLAQQQSELSEGLSVVGDTLQKLSENIPQMSRSVQRETGEALLSIERAVSEMADRQVDRATGNQKSSMTHLNNLALLLSDLMDQLMNMGSGSGGGMSLQQMLEQLRQMSGQQQQINDQIQQFLNDMVGNRLSVDQQQRLGQIRAQQEALRRQLEEMNGNGDAADRVLGDLKRIAEQMQESIEEMQRQDLGRPLVRRQQEILTRLLEAQRSMRERGREERRQSEQARDVTRTRPSALPPTDAAERLRRDLLRALESGYAPDYEELIKRYFEVLQERQRPTP